MHSQSLIRSSEIFCIDINGPKIGALGFKDDGNLRLKSSKKIAPETVVGFVQIKDLQRIVFVIANGQILMLDERCNVLEPKDVKLPDELKPHGVSSLDNKSVLIGCDAGSFV